MFECDDPVERDEPRGVAFNVAAGPQVARDDEVIVGRWVAGVGRTRSDAAIVASGVANLLVTDTVLYVGFGGPGARESQSKIITGYGLVDLYPCAFCCAWPLSESIASNGGWRLTLRHESPGPRSWSMTSQPVPRNGGTPSAASLTSSTPR